MHWSENHAPAPRIQLQTPQPHTSCKLGGALQHAQFMCTRRLDAVGVEILTRHVTTCFGRRDTVVKYLDSNRLTARRRARVQR